MAGVGKHSGVWAEPVEVPRRRLLMLALGVTFTLVAWGFLVFAAIDFGGKARSGETPAWVFLALATLGATACLFLTLILGNRLLAAMRAPQAESPPVVPGGRRAAR